MNIHRSYTRLLYPFLLGLAFIGYTTVTSAVDGADTTKKENIKDTEKLKKSHGRNIWRCRSIARSGSYVLRRNLSTEDTCLTINANHVTIDLNGYVISGKGADNEGLGITGSAKYGIHLRNGTITNFGPNSASGGAAIDLSSSKFSTLNEMHIDNNAFGAELGEGARVTNSIFSRTGGAGALALVVDKGSTVKDNTFYQNEIHLSTGSGSVVINNNASDGNIDSFLIGEKSLFTGNNVVDTSDEGVRVGKNSNVINNNAFGNGGNLDLNIDCPSNVVGNAVGTFVIFGDECNQVNNLEVDPN
jgi:hypothetical protein